MAQGKKSFVLYCDQRGLFDKLPNEVAGKLIKHIFAYVNDEQPSADDILIEIAFEAIKTQLKRDLQKWEKRSETSRINGSKGGRPKKPKETQKTQWVNSEPKKPVNVNDNVNVNVNDNEINYPYRGSDFLKKWNDWKAHRRAFDKFKYTPQSEKAALTKLQKLAKSEARAIAIIDQSIEKGWKGFFPLKQEDEPKTHVMPTPEDVLKVFPGVLKSFSAD